MSLLPLFVNSQYDVRSGWKFAAYSVLLVVLFIVTGTIFGILAVWLDPGWLLVPEGDIRFLALNAVVLFVPSASAFWLMARFDHIPIVAFGVTRHAHWFRDFGAGIAISVAMLILTFVGMFFAGNVQIAWNGSMSAMPMILLTLGALLISALNEELAFRGYPLQILMKGIGPWGAMLLISSIWGWLHSRNPGVTALGVANTIIAGVFFSRAYMETRSIWLPYGIHAGWNVGTSALMGLPVSGIRTASLLKTEVSGPDSLLGGSYGPEGSVLVTLIFLTGAIVIRRLQIGKVSPQIESALAANADKVYIEG